MLEVLREGKRHRPGGAWLVLIRAGSVAAALYVLWIGALAQMFGNAALDLAGLLHSSLLERFATWARAYTAYFHLETIAVAEGDLVARGATLGTVGMTGRVTGPHLHFAAQVGAARIDPAALLGLPPGEERD